MLKSQRKLYGLVTSGLKNVMPWPMKAPGPTPLPCGTIPPGNGLLSVATGVVRLLLLYCVVWLNPAWLTRYKLLKLTVAPVFELSKSSTGKTKIPNPARITVLFPSFAGDQAAPTRGLKKPQMEL